MFSALERKLVTWNQLFNILFSSDIQLASLYDRNYFPTVTAQFSDEHDCIFFSTLLLKLSLPTHRSVQFIRDLHAHADVSLAGCLGSLRNPHERFPPHLCTEAICSLQGWTFGVSFKVCFCGSSPSSCKSSRAAEARVYFYTGWKTVSSFPVLCLWQPLQSSLKLEISLGSGFDVNLPSQTSEASVFTWKQYPSNFFL